MRYYFQKIRLLAIPAVIATGLVTASHVSAQDNQEQWNCRSVEGEWVCRREESSRPAYDLPFDANRAGQDTISAQARLAQRIALDWVPKAALSEEEQAACPRGCKGGYVQPARDSDDADLDPRQAEMRAEAGSSQIDARSREATLDGDVVFTQGWRQVAADRVVVNREKAEYRLEGNVSIREPGLLVVGDSASVAGADNSLSVKNATYLLHTSRLRGAASEMRREGESQFVIEDASYTSCEPGSDSWLMSTSQLTINEETGRASGRNVVVRTAGIPVFYTPYISFSIDESRQSGLLYPSIKLGSEDGLDYEQPYYWNIAENQDATFSPRIIENRGIGLGMEYRYLTDTTYTESAGNYFADDTSGDRGGLYDNEARWLVNLNHQGYVRGFWTEWSIDRVSDIDYFEDYGSAVVDEASASRLEQYGAIGFEQGSWRVQLLAENFQSLVVENADQYQRLPELDVQGQGQLGADFWWQLDYQYSLFNHSNDDVVGATGFQEAADGTWVTGQRLRTELRTGWRSESNWYHFEPAVGIDYLYYRLDSPLVNQTITNPSEVAPNASIDFGLAFERTIDLFGHRWIQTLEPKFFYQYRDAGDQNDMPIFDTTVATKSYDQLFRRNNFVGGDRLSDSHQATVGISSSLYSFETGQELGRFRVAQAYQFQDRIVHSSPEILAGLTDPGALAADDDLLTAARVGRKTLNELVHNRSDLIATLDLNISEHWNVGSEVLWNGISSAIDRTQFQIAYQDPEKNRQIGVSYYREKDAVYLRDRNSDGFASLDELLEENVEQASVTATKDWDENWSLVTRWQYDFSNRRSVDGILGVSYQNCCWNASLTWRRWLERDDSNGIFTEAVRHDSGIFLGFEWVGLGGIGQSPMELLQRGRIH